MTRKTNTKAWDQIRARVADAARKRPTVQIGVFDPDDATIMSAHEYGSPAHKLPERAPIRRALAAHRDDIKRGLAAVAAAVVKGESIDAAIAKLGEQVRDDIRKLIRGGGATPADAPKTVEREGEHQPLAGPSGELVDAIESRVRK